MSGSTAAQFYSMPYTSAMTSHIVNASYSNNDNGVYLTSSMGAGPSTQSNANVNGENTPGSTKRPFPWASSESQERDKRPRGGSGNATTSSASEDPEETMSTDEVSFDSLLTNSELTEIVPDTVGLRICSRIPQSKFLTQSNEGRLAIVDR
jgi:hypothetical protein